MRPETTLVAERRISNGALLVPVQELWNEHTSPEIRWLSSHYAAGVLPDMAPLKGVTGLFRAMGIYHHFHSDTSDTPTWAFILGRMPTLLEFVMDEAAFQPRQGEPWPLEHPALAHINPYTWAASYHPPQPVGSPFLEFDALDELTAWCLNLAETVDKDKVALQLDMALQIPGFRVWIERRNILPLGLPPGANAIKAMESRFEVLDSPLSYPFLKRRGAKDAFREDVNLDMVAHSVLPDVPISNGKVWPMLCPRPNERWTMKTSLLERKKKARYVEAAPYLYPKGGKNEVKIKGVYFKNLSAACLYFRVPYNTVKSRMRGGLPLEQCMGIDKLGYGGGGTTVLRGVSYQDHWNRLQGRREDPV